MQNSLYPFRLLGFGILCAATMMRSVTLRCWEAVWRCRGVKESPGFAGLQGSMGGGHLGGVGEETRTLTAIVGWAAAEGLNTLVQFVWSLEWGGNLPKIAPGIRTHPRYKQNSRHFVTTPGRL